MTAPTLVTVGELLVEFVSHRQGCGLRQLSEYSGPYPSGAPAIFAEQAARCGAPSMIFGSVGQDVFGHALLERLQGSGVQITAIREQADLTTGTAFVSYYADGNRTFIFHLTDTAADRVEFEADDLPAGDYILHVSCASLGNPRLRTAVLSAVDCVVERGGSISCDPNARPELMQDQEARRALDTVVSTSRYLLPSTSDLSFLYPHMKEETVIGKLLTNGTEVIVLKRGARGVAVYADNGRFDIPAHTVTEIDPTGAGDCFCGTFMASLALGRTVEEAARLGNAAGAISVTRRGPMEGNSDLATIERFLATGQIDNSNQAQ